MPFHGSWILRVPGQSKVRFMEGNVNMGLIYHGGVRRRGRKGEAGERMSLRACRDDVRTACVCCLFVCVCVCV